MQILEEQLDKICQTILVSDILNYINDNRSKYEEYIIEEGKEGEENADNQGTS